MRLFIPNTEQKYSIDDKGVVICHYKYLKNGKIFYKWQEVKKYITSDCSLISIIINDRQCQRSVNAIMVDLFKIKKPDNYHYYDVVCIDGNPFNNSKKNIGFKIRVSGYYQYYPQPFYNKSGRIVKKTCCQCGITKAIKFFSLQKIKKGGQHKTFRNECGVCRGKRNWKRIVADPVLLKKAIAQSETWRKNNKRYFREYSKTYRENDKKQLNTRHIANSLHTTVPILKKYPDLEKAHRNRLLLLKLLKIKK